VNAPDTLTTTTALSRRDEARRLATEAREHLREVAKLLDDGRHSTAHHNVLLALTACTDALEAVQRDVEAELRQWALDHNELGKGEC